MARVVGLDIGTKNIRVVELERKKNTYILHAFGETPNPLQSFTYASSQEKKQLATTIKNLWKENNISQKLVNFALPEPQSFTQIIRTPLISDKELKASMQWQAEQYIPLPLDEVSYDYQILEEEKSAKSMRVLISAAPLELINKQLALIEFSGLSVEGLETQIISVIRSLSPSIPKDSTAALINLGYQSSDFAFATRESILLTRSISTGGKVLTKALSQNLNFSQDQAERYKITYGIDPEHLEGKIFTALKPILDQFIRELNKSFVYFKELYPAKKLDLVLICGGGALMPGIVRFMTDSFGIETQRAEPLANFDYAKKVQPPSKSSSELAVAVGLAMRK